MLMFFEQRTGVFIVFVERSCVFFSSIGEESCSGGQWNQESGGKCKQ